VEEATELVNNRKRWSAHLHAHSADLQNIIRGLAGHRVSVLMMLFSRNLNREDAMDRGRWKKVIKIG